MKTLTIDHEHENQRIDKYLKKLLVKAPSSLIYKMLRKKDVKVNGKRVKENYIVHYGDQVELFLYEDKFKEYTEPLTIKDLPITFTVAYEDEHILIVNKPVGLLVQPDDQEDVNTLSNQVLTYLYKQGSYDPEKNLGFTATSFPIKFLGPSSTIPHNSCPNTKGYCLTLLPKYLGISEPQIPQYNTFNSTLFVSSICGLSTSFMMIFCLPCIYAAFNLNIPFCSF